MLGEAVLRSGADCTARKVHPPSVISFHGYETDSIGTTRLDGGLDTQGFASEQTIVVIDGDVITQAIEPQREICTGTYFNDTIDREVLRIVFQIVPCLWHDVAHVRRGDVNVVGIIASCWLINAPIPVQEGGAIVPAIDAFILNIVQSNPQMTALILKACKGVKHPIVLFNIIDGRQVTIE